VSFKIEGIQEVSREIKSLGNDKMKRREILKVLRRQAKPIMQAMRQNAPESDNVIVVRNDVYYPGNLKKSIGIKTSPSKKYPNILVGPRYGRGAKKYDGFYAWWIEFGTGTHQANPTSGKNFVEKTWRQKGESMQTQASSQLKKYIDKKSKTLNL
jgi:HK97 gp10 family phage protein